MDHPQCKYLPKVSLSPINSRRASQLVWSSILKRQSKKKRQFNLYRRLRIHLYQGYSRALTRLLSSCHSLQKLQPQYNSPRSNSNHSRSTMTKSIISYSLKQTLLMLHLPILTNRERCFSCSMPLTGIYPNHGTKEHRIPKTK